MSAVRGRQSVEFKKPVSSLNSEYAATGIRPSPKSFTMFRTSHIRESLVAMSSAKKRSKFMPLVKISMLKIWNNEQKKNISDKIHESLVEAFKIPDDDYNHQLIEFDNDNYLYSKNKTEKYMLVEMIIFPGRSKKAKNELYEKIVNKLSEFGISAKDIIIVLNEPPLENWGLSGKSGEQTNIGFNLNV